MFQKRVAMFSDRRFLNDPSPYSIPLRESWKDIVYRWMHVLIKSLHKTICLLVWPFGKLFKLFFIAASLAFYKVYELFLIRFRNLNKKYKTLAYIKYSEPKFEAAIGTGRIIRLVPPARTKTLILDLDETLIHSNHDGGVMRGVHKSNYTPDFVLRVTMERHNVKFFVNKRPHVDYFLSVVSKWYDLVIYTASMEVYGRAVAEAIERKNGRSLFRTCYFRQHCKCGPAFPGYTKDLAMVSEDAKSDLSSVLIMDNSPSAYREYPHNAIPVNSWFSDPSDKELLALLPLLDALRFVSDVRSVLKRNCQSLTNGDVH